MKQGLIIHLPTDVYGNTVLHLAAQFNIPEVIDTIMLDNTIQVDQENYAGWTPAMLCAKHGSIQTLYKLLSHGADGQRALDGKYAGWVLTAIRQSAAKKNK